MTNVFYYVEGKFFDSAKEAKKKASTFKNPSCCYIESTLYTTVKSLETAFQRCYENGMASNHKEALELLGVVFRTVPPSSL